MLRAQKAFILQFTNFFLPYFVATFLLEEVVRIVGEVGFALAMVMTGWLCAGDKTIQRNPCLSAK